MSHLLFMDESGHDHRNLPYEVRGGIALDVGAVWPFVRAMHKLEMSAFGGLLHQYGKELKGYKLFDKDRFKWAYQSEWMEGEERRKACQAFLNRGLRKESPHRTEFTAYGQACLTMMRGIFELLRQHRAVVFAVSIPRGCKKPENSRYEEFLRRDHIFLLERYFGFLNIRNRHGLLILDETDKTEDRRFVQRMNNYFERTTEGICRASRIVPAPLFVASDMSYPMQAADCVIYCINWGFRLPESGMDGPTRPEVTEETASWIGELQARIPVEKNGKLVAGFGIVYIPDPYARVLNEKLEI